MSVATAGFTQIGALSVPAGRYVAFAKTWVVNTGATTTAVDCQLAGGGDSDDTKLALASVGSPAEAETVANNVVHDFASAGSFTLSCQTSAGTVKFSYIKITAIQVGNLTNSGF